MTEDIVNLGNLFRDKREEMHLSLKEVENATSIRMVYLQAIEDGKIEKHISAVYARGFIKQYASFLGFDMEKILKDYSHAFSQITDPTPEFDYGIGTLDVRNKNKAHVKRNSNLIWGGVSLIILAIAWLFAKFLGIF